MEKTIRKQSTKAELKISDLFKSKYALFLFAFISLIFFSHKYNQHPQKKTKIQAISKAEEVNTHPSNSREEVVGFATSLLGKNYCEAGKNPSSGFDCSGFTQYVFKNFSIEIPPSSITQSEFGTAVDLEEAKKGDLIFFKSPTIGNSDIGHVGIIVSNKNDTISFIHSSTSRGVVIDNLYSEHYKARFRAVRRVI